MLSLKYTDEEAERAYEEFYEDVHTEFLKFGEIINFKVCRNGSSHLRGNVYVHYKSLDSAVLSYQSVNGRYFAGKQLQCEFVGITRWRVAICGEFMKSKLTSCSRGTACNFIHCFRNPGGDYEWADWDKPPPKYWAKEMTALFGYSDQSVHKKTEQGSPRLISSARSLSRKTEFSSSSRNYSDDDSRSSESRRHSRSSDRKHSEKLDYEQHGDISNSREKQHSKTASIDHDSYRYWSDMDGVRQSYSSNLSPAHRKRKLEPRDGRGDKTNHETDPDENMHENDLESYHHERSRRSRRHGEKQGHRAGSKGDVWIEDEVGPSNKSSTNKHSGQQKKMSTFHADEWNSRGATTYNSDLTGDCSDGESQSLHMCREEESPRFDSCEEFEDRKKRRHTHKLKNSSSWDHSDRGNGEVERSSESLRDSHHNYTISDCSSKTYYRKDRQRVASGESERRIRVQHEKSERKKGTSDIEVTRLHATDNQINDGRDRWEPDREGSA